jgi:hypothetical protein
MNGFVNLTVTFVPIVFIINSFLRTISFSEVMIVSIRIGRKEDLNEDNSRNRKSEKTEGQVGNYRIGR